MKFMGCNKQDQLEHVTGLLCSIIDMQSCFNTPYNQPANTTELLNLKKALQDKQIQLMKDVLNEK